MNTLLPVTAGEMENYLNSTMNKLCHKNEPVLFSRYQYTVLLTLQSSVTLMAVVRERMLTYYNFIILLLCSKYIFS